MSSANYANIILVIQEQVDAITQTFTFNGYHALKAYLEMPLASLCVIYIILMGLALMWGIAKSPVNDFKKAVLRIGIVFTLGMNWDTFAQYFVTLFIDGAGEMGAVVMNASPVSVPSDQGPGMNGALQGVFNEIMRVGQWVYMKASIRNWSPAITGFLIELFGLVVIAAAFFELLVAKLMLCVCLCYAPLFFILTLFDTTKSFFDRWLGTLVGFSLVFVFVSGILGLCINLLHVIVTPHYVNQGADMTFTDWIPIALVSILAIMALFEVSALAKSIGGSCSTGHGSAMVGGFVGGALGASQLGKTLTEQSAKGARGLVNNRVTRKALSLASGGAGAAMKAIQSKLRGGK